MRRNIVSRKIDRCNGGFTLIETMFALLLMTMFITLFLTITYVLISTDQIGSHHGEEELGIFMADIKTLFDRSEDYWVSNDGNVLLVREMNRDEITSIERYEDKIRRRVSGSGHEVWMQFIDDFSVFEEPFGLRFEIIIEGKTYTRSLVHPSEAEFEGGSA